MIYVLVSSSSLHRLFIVSSSSLHRLFIVSSSLAAKYLLGDRHRGHGLRPASIEGQVGDGFDEFLLAGAVLPGQAEVVDELFGVPVGHEARDGDEAAVLRREFLARPDL